MMEKRVQSDVDKTEVGNIEGSRQKGVIGRKEVKRDEENRQKGDRSRKEAGNIEVEKGFLGKKRSRKQQS